MEAETKAPRKENPRARANPISALLFLYMLPIFARNFKKGLKEDDLFEVLKEDKSSALGDKLEMVWKEEHRKHKKSALHRSLFKLFGLHFMFYGVIQLINEISLVLLMPLCVGGFVSYFESGEVTEDQAYMYAGLLIFSIVADAFINHSSAMALMHMSMKMSVGCCSLIYRKSLRLSQSTMAQTTVGHVINLMSTDVSNFDYGFLLIHYTWIAPIQAIIGTCLLYHIIGVSAFSGISLLLLFIPLQIYFGTKKSKLRLRTAVRTDKRVNLMSEILHGIQVIKMYTWEKPFARLISQARRSEIKEIRTSFFLDAITFSVEMIVPGLATFISIIVFITLGNDINAEIVYSTLAIYDALRPTVMMMFSEAISNLAEVHITICRVQEFLSNDELNQIDMNRPTINENAKFETNITLADEIKISCTFPKLSLKHVCARWIPDQSEMDLVDVNVDVNGNQLVAIVGPVGSGKSTLFNVILKELPIVSGSIEIDGQVSYACQEAWLFSASVRQNILFGDPYDEDRYKTVIKMCALESDLAMFPYGDRTIVGEKGKVLSGGQKARINLARCIYKRADIYLLDDPLSAVDAKVGNQLFDKCITTFLQNKICILITHQLQYLKRADKIIILDEGKIVGQGKYHELKTSGLDFAGLLPQFQSEDEQESEGTTDNGMLNNHLAVPEDDSLEPEVSVEKMESGGIKAFVYADYFRAGGNWVALSFLVLCFIASEGASSANEYYISHWVNMEQEYMEEVENQTYGNDTFNREEIIFVYSGITVVTIFLALVQSISFFVFFMRASVNIHDSVFAKISNATMRFFNINPTGRILNRFSDDLGEIDEYIPGLLADVVQIGLQLIGAMAVTSTVNPWLLLPSAGLLLIFSLIRNVYMETSRNVKRIEGITRSPIFNHLTASLQGVTTIRALSAGALLEKEFDIHQDLHSSAWYLFISSSKAFGFWLDLICGAFVSAIMISMLIFNKNYYGGDAGLILTQFLSLTGVLQWGMHQWSELENHMTSVERVLEYKKVETEPVRKKVSNIPTNWPEYGKIVFQDVAMKYNPDEAPVLRNLNFTIYSCEKVGIVGRTGAGKSSVIAALFQLYGVEGSILIDDVDTTKLPLEELRSKISIIPQEPVLFSGTMRKNLDPFEEYSDAVLWSALEQVQLKEEIVETPCGLQTNVAEGGSNFSVGQRQLVCLARAIIRNNKILVMDEATANVDPQTDALIQETIREQFADCTVITIAHRLHTIMDSDRVLVIDAGKVVEFDHPYTLLEDINSRFYAMVQSTGKTIARNLHEIAEESFKVSKNS